MGRRRWLVRAFPRSWRARFGDELEHLLSDMEQEKGHIGAKDLLDVARAGLTVRLSTLGRHRRALVRFGVAICFAAAGIVATLMVASPPKARVMGNATRLQAIEMAMTTTEPAGVRMQSGSGVGKVTAPTTKGQTVTVRVACSGPPQVIDASVNVRGEPFGVVCTTNGTATIAGGVTFTATGDRTTLSIHGRAAQHWWAVVAPERSNRA